MSLPWLTEDVLELLHRMSCSTDHICHMGDQCAQAESVKIVKPLSEQIWREAVGEVFQILSEVRVHRVHGQEAQEPQELHHERPLGHALNPEDFHALLFSSSAILQALPDLPRCCKTRSRTLTGVVSLALKNYNQLLHMQVNLSGDPVLEMKLFGLAGFQVQPSAEQFLSIYGSRVMILKASTHGPGSASIGRWLYERSLQTAKAAILKEAPGSARRLASSHFALSCSEAGKNGLHLEVDELVWVLGFASKADIADLQDDIQRAHQVAEEADAAAKKVMRSI
eukprot:s561_g12.t1